MEHAIEVRQRLGAMSIWWEPGCEGCTRFGPSPPHRWLNPPRRFDPRRLTGILHRANNRAITAVTPIARAAGQADADETFLQPAREPQWPIGAVEVMHRAEAFDLEARLIRSAHHIMLAVRGMRPVDDLEPEAGA